MSPAPRRPDLRRAASGLAGARHGPARRRARSRGAALRAIWRDSPLRALLRDAPLRALWRDDRGTTSLEAVLILGVVSLPLLMFLAALGTRFITWMRDQAPNIFDEAATFTM